MFNPLLAGIVAGGAFLVSFIISLCVRTPFLYSALRALCFAGGFFGIIAGIYFLYNKFLSSEATEQFENQGGGSGVSGHSVDYSVGDDDFWLDGAKNMSAEAGPSVSAQNADDLYEPLEELTPENEDAPYLSAAPIENIGGADSGMEHGVLEQSGNKVYDEKGDSALTRDASASSDNGYDVNMSAFIPGMPAAGDGGRQKMGSPLYMSGPAITGEVPVSLSLDSKSGNAGVNFDFNKQKMAEAIQTLLRKDEG
ncbi:MAG: hypothetical protein LBF80_00525 [Spirochaetaceae bacterium]|nr:hypothetical protein [Spirochaetaceae bacterium]